MANKGQLWSAGFQYGREAVEGVQVPATRKAYFEPGSMMSITQAANEHRFAVGRRDNLLDVTQGPIQAAGTLTLPMSADEALEMWLITLQGGVTPTLLSGSTGVQIWDFLPSLNTDSMTLEWDDGANIWYGVGYKGGQLTITGDASSSNMISCDLFGQDVQTLDGGLTTGLSNRVPDFLKGWQTRL
jgi:hypothetical protein